MHDFVIEQGFFKELGVSAAQIDEMPWRQAWEYQVYIELIMRLRSQKSK